VGAAAAAVGAAAAASLLSLLSLLTLLVPPPAFLLLLLLLDRPPATGGWPTRRAGSRSARPTSTGAPLGHGTTGSRTELPHAGQPQHCGVAHEHQGPAVGKERVDCMHSPAIWPHCASPSSRRRSATGWASSAGRVPRSRASLCGCGRSHTEPGEMYVCGSSDYAWEFSSSNFESFSARMQRPARSSGILCVICQPNQQSQRVGSTAAAAPGSSWELLGEYKSPLGQQEDPLS
jgi:hypothetical protein